MSCDGRVHPAGPLRSGCCAHRDLASVAGLSLVALVVKLVPLYVADYQLGRGINRARPLRRERTARVRTSNAP